MTLTVISAPSHASLHHQTVDELLMLMTLTVISVPSHASLHRQTVDELLMLMTLTVISVPSHASLHHQTVDEFLGDSDKRDIQLPAIMVSRLPSLEMLLLTLTTFSPYFYILQ